MVLVTRADCWPQGEEMEGPEQQGRDQQRTRRHRDRQRGEIRSVTDTEGKTGEEPKTDERWRS